MTIEQLKLVLNGFGIGPDIVLDCSGFPETFVEAIRMVRVGGVVVEAGTFVDMGPVAINPNSDICTKNVSVIGVGGETATSYLPSMRLMAALSLKTKDQRQDPNLEARLHTKDNYVDVLLGDDDDHPRLPRDVPVPNVHETNI